MISVCIASYNGEKYIKEQLLSIIPQLDKNDEIIVSDDSSTDNTVNIVNEIGDNRIKVYNNDSDRRGCIGNFENALNHAIGDYIFLSDQDDVWMPDKIDVMIKELENHDVVVSDSIVTDSNLMTISYSFFKGMNSGPGLLKNIVRSTYYGSCMAFNKKTLKLSLPFPRTNEIGHDLWIGLVGEITGSVKFIDIPLIKYRRHESTVTSIDANFSRGTRSIWAKIRGRLIMISEVLKFIMRYYL